MRSDANSSIKKPFWIGCLLVVGGCCALVWSEAIADTLAVAVGPGGNLQYARDQRGNRIPDFSNCGYAGAEKEIPLVTSRITVEPTGGDDTSRIQAAIDFVADLPQDRDGFRGAVQLAPGEFQIAGQLRIRFAGIVLRGAGAQENGTTLLATGLDRRPLIVIEGCPSPVNPNSRRLRITDPYVPVGETRFRLQPDHGLKVGERVLITRPSSIEWIKLIGADAFGVGWKPGTRDIRWDRVLTEVDSAMIEIDAPITTAVDAGLGGATIERHPSTEEIAQIGVEDLRLRCAVASVNPLDEEHAWFGIVIDHAHHAWVRRVEFRHFAGGAVLLGQGSKCVTVEDCISLQPISELGGYRRHTYFTRGQLNLFLRCWSEKGRHDFAAGHCAAGPNAFVHCYADRALAHSGPIESWASGVLYDNVRIDGAGLHLKNGWSNPPGTGWSAANCVLWQCQAATVECFGPPAANNWAIGIWARFSGDIELQAESEFVRPLSLYQAQLAQRVGDKAARRVDPLLLAPVSATNPSPEEAAQFVAKTLISPPRRLINVIRDNMQRGSEQARLALFDTHSVEVDSPQTARTADHSADASLTASNQPLTLQNGWLTVDGALKTGGHLNPSWWRGTMRPAEAASYGPAITRFVPGQVGRGLTDDLLRVADEMSQSNLAVYDHHHGLWYDRRRDDHLMVRRGDGSVAPPFFEQPFARTGQGRAWDGLSQYDLTAFNPWYWQRLHEFARICDQRGLVLFHQHYFQHNILEAGAHWADCPWRPANNVNDTGLPEPPPYIGDKRIFLADAFYDIDNPKLRRLHRGYIRQCLDNFADCSNVVQMTSAEFTGPLEFVQFWIDCIIEWRHEHERDVFVGLSCTKDVQDAILADPVRGPHVNLIDIRYWTYTSSGQLYAPPGGKSLSPRQLWRHFKPKTSSFASVVTAVREYRLQFPEKAVTYYADLHCNGGRDGWAVLMGGGSLPNLSPLPSPLAGLIPKMAPAGGAITSEGAWCLAEEGKEYLICSVRADEDVELKLPDQAATYRIVWIDPDSGKPTSGGQITVDGPIRLPMKSKVAWLSRTDLRAAGPVPHVKERGRPN